MMSERCRNLSRYCETMKDFDTYEIFWLYAVFSFSYYSRYRYMVLFPSLTFRPVKGNRNSLQTSQSSRYSLRCIRLMCPSYIKKCCVWYILWFSVAHFLLKWKSVKITYTSVCKQKYTLTLLSRTLGQVCIILIQLIHSRIIHENLYYWIRVTDTTYSPTPTMHATRQCITKCIRDFLMNGWFTFCTRDDFHYLVWVTHFAYSVYAVD